MFEAAGFDGRLVALLGFSLAFFGGCLSLSIHSRKTLAIGPGRYLMLGVLMVSVSLASLLSTWLVVYRTPPYETGIKSGLWMSGVICLVALGVWQFFWFIIRRNLDNEASPRIFFKVTSSMVFLVMCVGISALLIQDGTRHPKPSATGPAVGIFTDGVTLVETAVNISDFTDEDRFSPTNFITDLRNTKPTPADNPYARIQWGLRLTGSPNGTARFAFIATPGAIDEDPTVVGATQTVSRKIVPGEMILAGSRGSDLSAPCTFQSAKSRSPYPAGSVLVTGYVLLDGEGHGAVGVTKRDHRSWAEAGGGINTVRLPRVYISGSAACMRGSGALEGEWQGAPERTVGMSLGVSELEFAKIEVFPKPTLQNQTETWSKGLAWSVSEKSAWNTLSFTPYYTIESPGTKDRATFTLFVAAVLLGASITVLFEMIRDIPAAKAIEPSPTSLHSSAADAGSADSPASAPELSPARTPTPSKPFRTSSRRPPKRWSRKR
ncbi:UNVERIFIED_CONTAM: hypothetical protein ABIE34_003898 [Jeotgalibacillus campisalis]